MRDATAIDTSVLVDDAEDAPAFPSGVVTIELKLEKARSETGRARPRRRVLSGDFLFDTATHRLSIPNKWWNVLGKLSSYSFDYGLAEGRFILEPRNLTLEERHLGAALPVDQTIEVTQTASNASERVSEKQHGASGDATFAAASAGKIGFTTGRKTGSKTNDGHQTAVKHTQPTVKVVAGGTAEAPQWRFTAAATGGGGRGILEGRWRGPLAEFTAGGGEATIRGSFRSNPWDIVITRVHDEDGCAELSGSKSAAIQALVKTKVRDGMTADIPIFETEVRDVG